MLDVAVPDIVIRGASANAEAVVVRGQGMGERQVGVAVSISAPRVTLADLTVGFVGYHGVQIRGERGASNAVLHNVQVIDTGQQLVKGSIGADGHGPDHGLVACSHFAYTGHAPSDYTNGIDVLGGSGWIVRDSRFDRIRGPQATGWAAGPAILFWANSVETVVERNIVRDSFRGIALGLVPVQGDPQAGDRKFDHQGGTIRQNIVVNLHAWADEGIEANAARDVRIDHNTVLVEGRLPWSISVRFPMTTAWVRNNLSNRSVGLRDGGRAERAGNIDKARQAWFVDAPQGNLRLRSGVTAPVDVGVPSAEIDLDFDRHPRAIGSAPDAGAFERQQP
jgi:hypothetical protein